MTLAVAPGDAVALTGALVAIDSRNPSLVPGGPGEEACARALAHVLRDWGFRVEVTDAAPGRPNVVARMGTGGGGRKSLLLNGHLDTVGVDGMTHAPWDPEVRDGRLYGRGSADMKAGIAAMCAAAWRAAQSGIGGEVIIAAVADEEYQSIGTRALVESGLRADAAIVTEPTRLAISPAHKGFVWADLDVQGVAAHGSRYDVGVDAISLAGHVIAEVDAFEREVLVTRTHPLLGRASVHASLITGGSGLSTYPDRCVVRYERRTIPGERAPVFATELEAAVARVHARRPELRAQVTLGFSQDPNDVAVSHPVVGALHAALSEAGQAGAIEGLSCWTDAALFTAAGTPAVCFGPGDIAVAHAAEEFVPIAEIACATDVLAQVIRAWLPAR